MSRAQELVDAHFDHYVGPLLTAAGVEEKVVALCAFMYKSSGIHFYKHAQEDAVEAARGAFANAAAHKAPSLCDSEVKQAVGYPFTFPPALKFMGESRAAYVSKLHEEVSEFIDAESHEDRMMELFDIIHAAETAIRSLAEEQGINPVEVADMVGTKNAVRGYYNR